MKRVMRIPADLVASLRKYDISLVDLVIYVNSECNLRCKHCYVGNAILNSAVELDAASVSALLETISSLDRITVLGGEPFLHSGINDIIYSLDTDRFREKRITTNLTCVDKVVLELCRNANIRVCVSLDGHTSTLHDQIRGPGMFYTTVNNLILALRIGLDVEITHTITQQSVSHIHEFVQYCKFLGVKRLNIHKISPRGNALKNAGLSVSATQWREMILSLEELSKPIECSTMLVRYEQLFVKQSEYDELLRAGIYHHHSLKSYYTDCSGKRVVLYPDGHVYISSEAFGTESYIGTFNNGEFVYNDGPLNEIIMAKERPDQFSITDINGRLGGDENYPVSLSVSYRKTIYV